MRAPIWHLSQNAKCDLTLSTQANKYRADTVKLSAHGHKRWDFTLFPAVLRRNLGAGHLIPLAEGALSHDAVVFGFHEMAADSEDVVDRAMHLREPLHVACGLESPHPVPIVNLVRIDSVDFFRARSVAFPG